MDKDIEETLDHLKSDEINIWELESLFKNELDYKILIKMFPEPMATMLKIIIKEVVAMLEFHDGKDSDGHPDIRKEIADLEAKLKEHRHELKNYSAKAEY